MKQTKQLAVSDKSFPLYRLSKPLTAPIAYPFLSFKIISGKNSLPEEGAAIVAGNHIHAADPVFVRLAQKRQIRFMAKSELFEKPFTRWLCTGYGAFPVVRDSSAATDAIRTSMRILRSGEVLGVFPEGTRSKDGSMGEGKPGIAIIAYKSQAPIYPFAVYCKRKPLSLFCGYTIAFGEPVTAAELGIIHGTSLEYRNGTARLMQIIADLRRKCMEARP